MLNNEKRTPEPFLQGFKPEFKIHPVFLYQDLPEWFIQQMCTRTGDGEIFIFPPAPLLTTNWQHYLEHVRNILGTWII
jgi:hypothetical protein